jgi:hypothetical protein
MSCVLRIYGKNFDVEGFLKETMLIPYSKFKEGDVMPFKWKGKSQYDSNGCTFDLSSADFDNFEQQKSDAIQFLRINFDSLLKLTKYGLSSDEVALIDFGIELNDSLAVQGEYLPPELLKLAGDLNFGIMLSQYSTYFKKLKT